MRKKPQYLVKNAFGIYYFRIRVPGHLQKIIKKRELKRSLRTTNEYEAQRLAIAYSVDANNLYKRLELQQMSTFT